MSASAATMLFWGLAALAVALALAFVLPFLMRRRGDAADPAVRREANLAVYREQLRELKAALAEGQISPPQFDAARLELQARAAEDALVPRDEATPAPVASRRLGVGLAAVLPAAAVGLYLWLGNPAVIAAIAEGPAASPAAGAPTREDILGMVRQIEARTGTHPTDAAAWTALGMANGLLARWPEAAKAFQEADRLQPDTPSILAGYAESLAMTGNQTLAGRPIELVDRALRIDPSHPKALELAGIHAYQTQAFDQAATYLDRLSASLPADAAHAREIRAMRDDARRRAQEAAGPAAPATAATAATPRTGEGGSAGAAAGATVSGRVDVAEALRSRIGREATVFVLARAADGGPPLAAVRVPVGPLPLSFRLSDAMSMMPGHVLSRHQDVTLVARISASGNPIAQPGDLEGRLVGVPVGSTDVNLVIDRVLP